MSFSLKIIEYNSEELLMKNISRLEINKIKKLKYYRK